MAILYVTLKSPESIQLALSMPILFTVYGTFVTLFLGVYLKQYKFITIKKNKKWKKLSSSIFNKFKGKKKPTKKGHLRQEYGKDSASYDDGLKSIASTSSSDLSDENAMDEIKEKCKQLFQEIPESAIQPEKIMEFQYGSHYDDDDDSDECDDGEVQVINNVDVDMEE
mmetsp:Transcript_28077/g.46224  ORF Transcript_28077/g.46224 Transcript_28077/m.46224 type:complete len:168 (+) Transcript_28077:2-505(+)